jgi:cysteinyl-tRNA synthetase
MKPFYIFNTLSRRVEEFHPLNPPTVTLYSCGPTVYLPPHLGNLRAYVFVDTLRRALEYNGFAVRHAMNVTDVGHMTSDADEGEDKIEKSARAQGKSPLELANFYLDWFLRDIRTLNIEEPHILCRATENIDAMIALIGRIIERGYGYVVRSGVYFDVEKWRGPTRMGRLSRQSLDEQHSGQRMEHAPDKRSPHDFALWVLNQPHHLMQWDSPWGRGYPGWHIECSAMSMKYLGETIDIHTGGLDHIPIHHENEIAQSEAATGHPFVRYFVHNAFVVGMEGAKLSKSSGRFPVLDDLRSAGLNVLAFRLLCLGAKYRSELEFSLDAVRAAEKNLFYFYDFAWNLPEEIVRGEFDDSPWVIEYRERFVEAINNDLNTPDALAVMLDLVHQAYLRDDRRVWKTLADFDRVFALGIEETRRKYQKILTAEIRDLVNERERARKLRDFKRADAIRQAVLQLGIVIEDTPAGPRPKPRWTR